jgi:hypothetical protein
MLLNILILETFREPKIRSSYNKYLRLYSNASKMVSKKWSPGSIIVHTMAGEGGGEKERK